MFTFKVVDRSLSIPVELRLPRTGTTPRYKFEPKSIIHCKYAIDPGSDGQGMTWLHFKKEIKTYSTHEVGLTELIKKILNETVDIPPMANAPDPTGPEATPFDIGVTDQCYVAIELDRRANWTFSTKNHAMNRKDKANADEDLDLMHVRPVTGKPQEDPVENDWCKLIYFSVAARADAAERLFAFNVRFTQDRFTTEFVIDPDIPNTGDAPFPGPDGVLR